MLNKIELNIIMLIIIIIFITTTNMSERKHLRHIVELNTGPQKTRDCLRIIR